MTYHTHLQQDRIVNPDWLQAIHVKSTNQDVVPHLLSGRWMFYPGAGRDLQDVLVFKGVIPVFVQLDIPMPLHSGGRLRNLHASFDFEHEIVWHGYVGGGMPSQNKRFDEILSLDSIVDLWQTFGARIVIYQAQESEESELPIRFALVQVRGWARYWLAHAISLGCTPYACLLQDHGFGGDFECGKLFQNQTPRRGGFTGEGWMQEQLAPHLRWLVQPTTVDPWEGWTDCGQIDDVCGGMYDTPRSLFAK